MSPSPGQILENRYRIDELLGQGGMGAVYRSTDLRFNATVALKENRMVTAASPGPTFPSVAQLGEMRGIVGRDGQSCPCFEICVHVKATPVLYEVYLPFVLRQIQDHGDPVP
jgi:anthranilate/para-aminobenzoate synthase component II